MPGYTPPNPQDFEELVALLDFSEFEIPRGQEKSGDDFPVYLQKELDRYSAYYEEFIQPYFDRRHPLKAKSKEFIPLTGDSILSDINHLIKGINTTISYYYEGKLLQATQAFRESLNFIGFKGLTFVANMASNCTFYRTRSSNDHRLTKKEIFHNPFQNRGRVATSRYSIPGLPALYLGDSVYVCWEEANQQPIGTLYFSRFCNRHSIKIVRIQRIDDFIDFMKYNVQNPYDQLTFLTRYLAVFPLCIACSIKTKSNTDTFKPEYIIPQLLLQYVTAEKEVEGIMFPSTKVDYKRIRGVSAYNYVFPVKQIKSRGYCTSLIHTFELTEPTSTESEALMSFSNQKTIPVSTLVQAADTQPSIALVKDEYWPYLTTVFGYLEQVLERRRTTPLEDAD